MQTQSDKLSNVLSVKSLKDIINIWKELKVCDINGTGVLKESNTKLLLHGIKESMITGIDYNHAITAIIGTMSEERLKAVTSVYDGALIHRLDEFKKRYDPKNHPYVIAGKATMNDIFNEFIESIDIYHNIILGKRGDTYIPKEEFISFFSIVSYTIKDQKDFIAAAANVWHFPKSTTGSASPTKVYDSPYRNSALKYQKPKDWKSPTVKITTDYENLILKLKNSLSKRGVRGIIGLAKTFKMYDPANQRILEPKAFLTAISSYKVGYTDDEASILLKESGGCYMKLIEDMKSNYTKERSDIAKEAYVRIAAAPNIVINKAQLNENYNAKLHPYVQQGFKTPDEITEEFIETYDMFHCIIAGKANSNKVSMDDFVDYYGFVSSSVTDNNVYAAILNQCWQYAEKIVVNPNYSVSKLAPFGTYQTEKQQTEEYKNTIPDLYKIIPRAGLQSAKVEKKKMITIIINNIKNHFANKRFMEFLLFKKSLAHFDFSDIKSISSLFTLFKLKLSDVECNILKANYGEQCSYLIADIIQSMNRAREEKITQVFSKIFTRYSGVITLDCLLGNGIIRYDHGQQEIPSK